MKADIFVGAMDDGGNTSDVGREEAVFRPAWATSGSWS